VSVAGGLAHNAGQVLVAVMVVENVRIGYYFLPLAVAGVITGALIGVIAELLIPRLLPLKEKMQR
jgi:heptaprenyl diphosphate synthase